MSFLRRIIESTHPYKKQKRNPKPVNDCPADMPPLFMQPTHQFLNVPPVSRRSSTRSSRVPDDVDNFLSSDLELSFASTVSLHSPPRDSLALTPESDDSIVPMDISPAPPPRPKGGDKFSRPRAFTSAARLFGRDMSNASNTELAPTPVIKQEGSVNSSSKRTQRSALPMEWFNPPQVPNPVEVSLQAPLTMPPTSPGDAMDVDSDPIVPIPTATFSAMPRTAAPTVTTFNNLFFETVSPRRSFESPAKPQHKKRRSASPEPTRYNEVDVTSSPAPSSPSQAKLERMRSSTLLSRFNSKPTLEGLGAPSVNGLKRPRRPALSALIQPSNPPVPSAYPVLGGDETTEEEIPPSALPPTRRAFSALLPPKGFGDFSSDEASFDGPDMSSPAQAYAKRQQVRTIRRCDGTDDFRPLTGATAMVMRESPNSRFAGLGLPGFGDNEAHGKLLPCHRVTDDGLMRITPQTLNAVLDGAFDDKISNYHIIDCRFDYEYNGGHVSGAININTTTAVEELLLGAGVPKPRPSVSGDSQKKTVLIFHCEFSVKRAPTFAKHLRAKDRAMNNHVYPKIHYPEVYILEGGYCRYFEASGPRCLPPAYVRMDDPDHANSRREDLDQFRKAKFGRHKSYTYGDVAKHNGSSAQPAQPKRNTIPTAGPNSLFAAANAARTRRVGGLSTLAEDADTTTHTDDEDTDIGDSPCPPPNKAAAAAKFKKPLRPLIRAETYGPTRMSYC